MATANTLKLKEFPLEEVIGVTAIFTVIIAGITGASFWQSVGVFAVVYILVRSRQMRPTEIEIKTTDKAARR